MGSGHVSFGGSDRKGSWVAQSQKIRGEAQISCIDF